MTAVTPSSSSNWALRSVQVSGGGADSGRSRRTGCGSKVKTMAGPREFAGLGQQPLDQPGMAAMDAVEIADRDRTVAEIGGQAVEGAEKTHGGKKSGSGIRVRSGD